MTPIWTALISSVSALSGAGIGFLGARHVAKRNREAEIKRRSVDRLIEGLDRLEAAYLSYRDAVHSGGSAAQDASNLAVARRFFDRTVELFSHTYIRGYAKTYGDNLQTHYLYGDGELDELEEDLDIVLPSEASLRADQKVLLEKLRNYEAN